MLLAVEVDEGRVRTRLLDDIHGRHDLPEAASDIMEGTEPRPAERG